MVYTNATAVPREELTDVIMEGVADDEQFMGLRVLPEAPLSMISAHVPKIKIGEGDLMRASKKRRTPGAHFDRWQSSIGDYSITLVQVGEEVLIPDEVQSTYEDYFDLEAIYLGEASERLKRGVEIDQATVLFDAGAFVSANSAVAYTLANVATINFILDVLTAIRAAKARGERPDTIVMSGIVYDLLRQTTKLQQWIAGSINPNSVVTPETITASLKTQGIKQVLVMDSYVNESDAGQADVINPIWNNTYVFVGSVKDGALRNGGVGRTFFWEKEGPLFNVSSYRDESRKSNVIRAMKTAYPYITNARAGQLITTQYS